MHANQVIKLYRARETDFRDHKVLMFTINLSAPEAETYEAVRYAWKLDEKRARKSEYVLAVQRGLVVGVFKPTKWLEATKSNFPHREGSPGRWGFVGKKAPPDITEHFMGTRLPSRMRKKGAANPIRYSY